MADLTVTAANVAAARAGQLGTEIYPYIAAASITAGQAVYMNSSGQVDLASTGASGTKQFHGIALKTVGAGEAVPVLQRGYLEGYDLSGLAYDAIVYGSDTAGNIATAAGTATVQVGRVVPTTEKDPVAGTLKKLLHVNMRIEQTW